MQGGGNVDNHHKAKIQDRSVKSFWKNLFRSDDSFTYKPSLALSGRDALSVIEWKDAPPKNKLIVGVTISSEVRNIVQWRAVDKDGKVIDEQRYE